MPRVYFDSTVYLALLLGDRGRADQLKICRLGDMRICPPRRIRPASCRSRRGAATEVVLDERCPAGNCRSLSSKQRLPQTCPAGPAHSTWERFKRCLDERGIKGVRSSGRT